MNFIKNTVHLIPDAYPIKIISFNLDGTDKQIENIIFKNINFYKNENILSIHIKIYVLGSYLQIKNCIFMNNKGFTSG